MRCFPEPYTHSKSKIKVELNLSKFAAKSDLKNAIVFDTSDMAKKADLANKLDIGKLKNILVDLCKLSDLVKK